MRRFLAVLCFLPALAFAQQAQRVSYKISSGTGFVINNEGHVVTNKHVVTQCKNISILTLRGEEQAELVAEDKQRDLAVLKTRYIPQRYASLRWNIDSLEVGSPVVVMGFPGKAGSKGTETFRTTRVKSLRGPQGEDRWIQLVSVAKQGNSGGPVLDASGNVIAVVTGIALTYRANKQGEPVGNVIGSSDVAITLPALRDFLTQHSIGFYESSSGAVGIGEATLRDDATHFIVPVRCILNEA